MESKFVGGTKRKRNERIQDDSDKKSLILDVMIVNMFGERVKNHKSVSISAESIKEEKEKGFGFSIKKDE